MPDNAPHLLSLKLQVAAGDSAAFDEWRAAIAPLFDVEANPPEGRPDFYFDAVTHNFADANISAATSAPQIFDRNDDVIARAGVDSVMMIVLTAGGGVLAVNGCDIALDAGDVFVADMTQTWTLLTPVCTLISMGIPRAVVAEFISDIESLHGALLPRDTPSNRILVSHLRSLLETATDFSMAEARAVVRASAAMFASYAGLFQRQQGTASKGAPVASLRAVRQAIEENIGNANLDTIFLLRRFGVSRATLYRLFAPMGGVRAYIQQRRLTRAYQSIADPASREERIIAIATRQGFPNNTAFSRAFRKAYGISPGDMRAMLAKGVKLPGTNDDQPHDFERIRRWLLGRHNQGR